jgi:hypothetical protein
VFQVGATAAFLQVLQQLLGTEEAKFSLHFHQAVPHPLSGSPGSGANKVLNRLVFSTLRGKFVSLLKYIKFLIQNYLLILRYFESEQIFM